MATTLTTGNLCDQITSALDALAEILGIDESTFAGNELLAVCSVTKSISPKKIDDLLAPEQLQQWLRIMGTALTFVVTVEDLGYGPQRVTCDDEMVVQEVLEFIRSHEVEDVEVEITLSKHELRHRLSTLSGVNLSALFLYEGALCRRMSLDSVEALVREGLLQPTERTTIGIVAATGLLQGPFLTVVGLADMSAETPLRIPSVEPEPQNRWAKACALRQTVSTWTAPLSHLPPDVFSITEHGAGLQQIATALAALSAAMSLLQMCEVVFVEEHVWIGQVTRRQGPECRLTYEDIISYSSRADDGSTLFALYRWAFPSESRSRVDVVRHVIQETVQRTGDSSLSRLETEGKAMFEAAQANYSILCHDAFESYLKLRESAEEHVQSQIDAARGSATRLTEELLGTFLQFFAGTLVFIITNSFSTTISEGLRICGLVLALVYLALVAVFRLVRAWSQHTIRKQESEAMIERYSELADVTRKSLIESLDSSQKDFVVWFWACTVAYAAGGVALLVILAGTLWHWW